MTKRRRKRLEAKLPPKPSKSELIRIPDGAVAADTSNWVPNNSYDCPPPYYIDKNFHCKDCGKQEVWTAEQQKWYFEEAKGSLYATAVRCRECRDKIKAKKTNSANKWNTLKKEPQKTFRRI